MSDCLTDCLTDCLINSPVVRVLVVQALREVVGKCLDKNPEARPTAADLLKHKFFKVSIGQTQNQMINVLQVSALTNDSKYT